MKLVRTAIITTLTTLLLSLSLGAPSWAQWGYPPQQRVASERDVQGLQHQLDLLNKDFERLQGQTDRDLGAHKERILDLHAKADWFGLLMTVFAIIIALATGVTYVMSTRKAKDEVRKWAGEQKADLLKEIQDEAKSCLTELEQQAQAQINEHVTKVKTEIEDMKKSASLHVADIEKIKEALVETPHVFTIKKTLGKGTTGKPQTSHTSSDKSYAYWETKAFEAQGQGNINEALEAFMYAQNVKEATSLQIANAILYRGSVLQSVGRLEEAISAFDELVNLFGSFKELKICEQVANALFKKGVVLGEAGRTEEALAVFDEIVTKFGDYEELELRETVADSLYNKGVVLGKAGRMGEALDAFDVVSRYFGEFKEQEFQETVADAEGFRGFARLMLAKEEWLVPGNAATAKALLTEALSDVEAAMTVCPNKFIHISNQGYALFLLGRADEAEAPLRRALELGGEEAFNNALEDAKIHPVPEDKAFIALVERLWAEVQAAERDA